MKSLKEMIDDPSINTDLENLAQKLWQERKEVILKDVEDSLRSEFKAWSRSTTSQLVRSQFVTVARPIVEEQIKKMKEKIEEHAILVVKNLETNLANEVSAMLTSSYSFTHDVAERIKHHIHKAFKST